MRKAFYIFLLLFLSSGALVAQRDTLVTRTEPKDVAVTVMLDKESEGRIVTSIEKTSENYSLKDLFSFPKGLDSENLTIWISFIALIVTAVGLYQIVKDIRLRRYTFHRQQLFLKDLIRHLFVNSAITEVLKIKSNGNWDNMRPKQGVFSRFAFLDNDCLLNDIRVKDKQFIDLHSLCVFIRNYNIASEIAEKTFNCQSVSKIEKELEIRDIEKRTFRLVEEIMALGTATGLLDKRNPEGDVALFIKEYYKRKDSDKEVDPNFKVPERKKDLVIFDTDKFGLKEEFDRRIALRSEDIEVLEF